MLNLLCDPQHEIRIFIINGSLSAANQALSPLPRVSLIINIVVLPAIMELVNGI